ncbi:aldehyde dehydrogenase family protein [Paenarthrobacter sp. OM7]|uniref:aldehyde dehydrogenase family protein n=1 Tax=Paenarthrobacter sp. OM7 TaxID=3041264 RepID=UPI0024697614|nr:aldehyde dehydrogenase family protein [Paenarthrobacter sp. OM7]WGM20481.1 aldehyde dehydrogenase family protein [Paenarthrobacter sp. OM7]
MSLTGSERAGAAVAEAAGRNLKEVVLELGGSDPFIVLEDVDLETVVQRAVAGRMVNGGQACNAAKRFVVMEAVYEGFVRAFCQALAAIAPGDPTAPGTYLGPLSCHAAADQLQAQLDAAVAEGATLLLSGGKVAADSAYFRPAVIGRVTRDMDAYGQEFFGPVAMVFKAATESEAVAIANDTAFGPGASVHSGNTDRAARIGERLTAGMVRINECGGTAAELPFGGVKRSGIGRELGRYGMDEFVNKKLLTLKD